MMYTEEFKRPRYYHAGDFTTYAPILEKEGCIKTFHTGDYIKKPNELFQYGHYIIKGICKFAVLHENGQVKTIAFYGPGSIFSLYSPPVKYKLERDSVLQIAITNMTTVAIPQERLRELMRDNTDFHFAMTDAYVQLVNQFAFEASNQQANDSMTRICNFMELYRYAMNSNTIYLSQEEIGQAIGLCRTNVAKQLSILKNLGYISLKTKCIQILRPEELLQFCSCDVLS